MTVEVESGARWCAPEVGLDWDALEPGNWLDRGLVVALETPTPEELDDWFRSYAPCPPAMESSVTVSTDRLAGLEAALGTADEAWVGVDRIPPRPLPGVTGVAGPSLAPALLGLDLAQLSPAQLVEAMTGAERLCRWAQRVQLAAVKAFADYSIITDEDSRDHPLAGIPGNPHVVETGFGTQREIERFCSDGIGAALGTSFTAAQQLIDAAYFAADVPRAAAMLAAGLVDVPRLKVLARELVPVGYATPEDQAFVDDLLDGSGELTPKKLEARLRTAVMARRPDGAEEAHSREKKSRGVWVNRKQSGMATLTAYLTAEEAQMAYQALNAHAWGLHDAAIRSGDRSACSGDEGKSFDNLRADALMDLMSALQSKLLAREDESDSADAADSETEAESPVARSARTRRYTHPARVMLHLYMQASTLAGFDQHPATLLGYGPIGAEQARRIAENAALTRILTDPFTGEIKAIDLPAYRVPKVLRMAVQARDRSCVFPGCDVPAYDTQIDHIVPHPFARRLERALAKGRTSFSNLQSLCLRHHYLKTHGGWTIQSTSGARLEWISPTGHSYRRNAEWGPPEAFYRDHDPTVPVDQPAPPPPQDQIDPSLCPF